MTRHILRMFEDGEFQAWLANADFFADRYFVGRNVYFSAANLDMPVAHQLTSLASGSRKTETKYDVVEATFQLLQEYFAGYAFGARGFFKVVAELVFQREVHALGLLLFPELQTVANHFGFAVLAMALPDNDPADCAAQS